MADSRITIVSALFRGPVAGRAGAQSSGALLRAWQQAGLPLVVYADEREEGELRQAAAGGRVVLRLSDERQFREGLWLHDEFARRTEAVTGVAENPSAVWTRMRSVGLLHDESLRNPFGSAYFVWLDPALFEVLPAAYVAFLPRLLGLLDRFLVLRVPEDGLTGAEARLSMWLFGAPQATLSRINQAYWHSYGRCMGQGLWPSPEGLLARVRQQVPECFHHVDLQSNGLPGPFFESLRHGQVVLEMGTMMGAPRHG